MTNIHVNGTAAQSPPLTVETVADFNDAIRNARFALRNGPPDRAIVDLEKASRLAPEVGNPHAHQLANFANELRSAFETVQLVEMCLLDLLRDQ
jgi:hypothetical protein